MCVVVAKWFENIGWVAVKNRDRNYTPEISFRRVDDNDGIERLLFEDDVTKYMEGINSAGLGILGASLMVQDDEKEITKGKKSKSGSPDGIRIKQSLSKGSARESIRLAIGLKLTGHTIFVDEDDCYLLEASKRNDKYEYKAGKIPKGQVVARSNHGIWLPWAGYQRGKDKNQELSRISSEARLAQAEYVVNTAKTPQELIDSMCKMYINSPQLNIMRTDTERKKMRTTAQLMTIPSEKTLFCRPVSSTMTFDFWKLNKPGASTWVEILSNRALYRDDSPVDPPFDKINPTHSTR
jgi:hypothetical protein